MRHRAPAQWGASAAVLLMLQLVQDCSGCCNSAGTNSRSAQLTTNASISSVIVVPFRGAPTSLGRNVPENTTAQGRTRMESLGVNGQAERMHMKAAQRCRAAQQAAHSRLEPERGGISMGSVEF